MGYINKITIHLSTLSDLDETKFLQKNHCGHCDPSGNNCIYKKQDKKKSESTDSTLKYNI